MQTVPQTEGTIEISWAGEPIYYGVAACGFTVFLAEIALAENPVR
jgi:hypothetical protein